MIRHADRVKGSFSRLEQLACRRGHAHLVGGVAATREPLGIAIVIAPCSRFYLKLASTPKLPGFCDDHGTPFPTSSTCVSYLCGHSEP
jgi:hypothetical protein